MSGTTLRLFLFAVVGLIPGLVLAEDEKSAPPDIGARRMEVMKKRIDDIRVSSPTGQMPERMQMVPLFRYDDETRGYVDGTVWRLGESGRPLAIVTAELHPRYLNNGSVVVYDLLSLTNTPFTMRSDDLPGWSPGGSAVTFQPLPNGPVPAVNPATRLAQIKEQSRRFTATQDVMEIDTQFVHLRLLPKEIDRYTPSDSSKADGAIFLLVNGRNPAILLLIETDGKTWQWAAGRLSLPSNLELLLDDQSVWKVPRYPQYGWNTPYCATNRPAVFP